MRRYDFATDTESQSGTTGLRRAAGISPIRSFEDPGLMLLGNTRSDTLIKKLSQSTKPSKVKERVANLDLVRGLYHQLSPAFQAIGLKPGGIQY
jgi:hypothetical protein